MRHTLLLLSVASVALFPLAGFGQAPGFGGQPEKFEPILRVDWASFRAADSGQTRLEAYYQVYNFGLQFAVDGQEYVANYDISAEVMDNDGNQIESFERSRQVRAASQAQTRSRYDFRTSQFNIDLPPGKYVVRFLLSDKGNGAQIRRDVKVSLPNYYTQEATMSGIEFVHTTSASSTTADTGNVFVKGDSVVIPSVSREFGGEEDSLLRILYELYSGSVVEQPVIVQTVIRQRSRGTVFRDTAQISLGVQPMRKMLTVNVGELPPGEYGVEMTLHGRRMKELDRKNEMFSIRWTEEGLLKHDWKSAVSQLSYIAAPGEQSKLKKAKTMEERRTVFAEFWSQRDPTIGTPENETKREFYHRINVADRQFSSMRREGWKSDRGRIYIIHGEPDQIDDEPYSPDVVPYQIWHYYREGRYRRFLFIDKSDDGDYRLQYPYDGLNQRPDF